MGHFVANGLIFPNHLMYRAQDRLLELIVPTGATFGLTFEIGMSGPQYQLASERPNPDAEIAYSLSRRGQFSDYVGNYGNEGCAPSDDARTLFDYARQAVTWSFTNPPGGVIIDTGWHQFENDLTWARHGDWQPVDWDEDTGTYPQPWDYTDCPPQEGQHDYPWCTARVHDDWWTDQGCAGCASIGIRRLGCYPAGAAFVLVDGPGTSNDEVLAAAELADPLLWRAEGDIRLQYRGRFGAPYMATEYIRRMVRYALAGTAHPWSNWRAVPLTDGVIQDGATLADVTQAFTPQAADTWDVQPYVSGDASSSGSSDDEVLPYAYLDDCPLTWTNTGSVAVTVRSVAIIADNSETSESQTDILFWSRVSPAVTVAPGETFELTEFVVDIREIADG